MWNNIDILSDGFIHLFVEVIIPIALNVGENEVQNENEVPTGENGVVYKDAMN